MVNLSPFGIYFRAYRKEHKLSQEAVAEKTGISLPMMNKMERGQTTITKTTLDRIYNSYQFTPEQKLEIWISAMTSNPVLKLNWDVLSYEQRRPIVELAAVTIINSDLVL